MSSAESLAVSSLTPSRGGGGGSVAGIRPSSTLPAAGIQLRRAASLGSASSHGRFQVSPVNPTPEESKEMQIAAPLLSEYLTYIPWVKSGSMYVEDVVDMIKEKNTYIKSKNNGKGFDLVIDDYPGKLASRATGKNQADHAIKTHIYDQFVTLAIEEQFHMIVPLQSNRGGYKKAKELKSGSSLIDQSDVADAYNIVQRASNVITINSSKLDKEKQVVRYLIDKSRSSQTGKIFVSSTAFDRSTSHSILNASTTYSEGSPKDDISIYSVLGATETAKMAAALSLIQGDENAVSS